LIWVVDATLMHWELAYGVQGVLDETAHLATGLLFLMALPRRPPKPFVLGCLVASVLIDADHIPIVLHFQPLIAAAHRPYTHSLSTVAVVLVAGLLMSDARRACAFGAVAGLLIHFFRDIATGFVPLAWPVSTTEAQIPYTYYFALMVALAAAAASHARWPGHAKVRERVEPVA